MSEEAKKRSIVVTAKTLGRLYALIKGLSGAADTQTLGVRAWVLDAVRMLLRDAGVCAMARDDIVPRVLVWCKDGKHIQFNKCAWRLFFELIEYHGGMLEYLDEKNNLMSFTDIIGATLYGNSVLIHCIHYIAKIFSLAKAEQARAQEGLPPKRDDGRLARDDVKYFVNYFRERALFIKFHMIYIRVHKARSGAVFLELARFYNTLCTVPECSKLLSTIQKNKDYKQGIETVNQMFSSGTH